MDKFNNKCYLCTTEFTIDKINIDYVKRIFPHLRTSSSNCLDCDTIIRTNRYGLTTGKEKPKEITLSTRATNPPQPHKAAVIFIPIYNIR